MSKDARTSRLVPSLAQLAVLVAVGFGVNGAQVTCTPSGASPTIYQRVTALEEKVARLEEHSPRRVFVSSQTYNGNLGGIAGAQAICNQLAAAAGLEGSFDAWLSTEASSPNTRFVRHTGPYIRVDGTPVAWSYVDLTDGFLFSALRMDENGDLLGESDLAWTGTSPQGDYQPTTLLDDCSDWTNGGGFGNGFAGRTFYQDANWSTFFNAACGSAQHLYCFEQ
jgi:hypothetical protein